MNYDYDFSSLINNLKFSKQKNIHHPPSLPHKINKQDNKMPFEQYLEKLTTRQLLTPSQLHTLTRKSIQILIQQPNVIQMAQPECYIVGDIHGQFYDLLNMLHNIVPDVKNNYYVFLGDYVDRGYNSVETISLLLIYKCLYKDRIVMLRGNHQTSSLTKIYGFYDEVVKKYGNSQVWGYVVEVFQYLPLAAIVQERIMCVHGGLSPSTPLIDNIAVINRIQEIPEAGPLGDLVWSDPDSNLTSWAISNRGAGYLFPHQAAKQFLFINNLKTIARAHQLVEQGHLYNFSDESVVTVWSAPNYCYRCGNKASVMKVKEGGKVINNEEAKQENKQEGKDMKDKDGDNWISFIQFTAADDNIRFNISCDYVLPYFL